MKNEKTMNAPTRIGVLEYPNPSHCTFAGAPGGDGFAPRYLLPALAEVLGGGDSAWRAASWVVLSHGVEPLRDGSRGPRAKWRWVFGNARHELRSYDVGCGCGGVGR